MANSVLIFGDEPTDTVSNIYMFDLDGTLITTKTGNKFPRNAQDWRWLYDCTLDRLRPLTGTDAWIVIVSNQKVASSNVDKRNMIKNKLKGIHRELLGTLDAPITFYAALGADRDRKPSTGIFEDHVYPHASEKARVVFVGDAAGRPGDHSDSDRKFAYNVHLYLRWASSKISIKFYTPEEYFLHQRFTNRPEWTGFNPQEYLNSVREEPEWIYELPDHKTPDGGSVLIIMMGAPASGKSTFARRIVADHPGWVYFGLDDMPRKKNYDAAFLEACDNGVRSIVVDATNPGPEARMRWTKHSDLFAGVYVYILPSKETSDRTRIAHMNVYRCRINRTEQIPEIAYRMFYKRYISPQVDKFSYNDIIFLSEPRMSFQNKRDLMYFLQLS